MPISQLFPLSCSWKNHCVLLLLSLAFFSSATLAHAETVKVFFLVGQSNMEGKGNPLHLDTYRDDPLIKPTYASLKNGENWRVRDDVWITYPSKARGAKHGPLTVGYGTKEENSIGPEFGFGHTVGNAIKSPVLIIKIAWGGKSLAIDFRPPSAPPSEAELKATLNRLQKRNPETTLDDVKEQYGHYYREMIRHAKEELAAIPTRFPELKDAEVEIAGFVWHQGFNDIINRDLRENKYEDYTEWLGKFIRDVRKDLNSPQMPFVIGELSTGGIPNRGDFQIAQANAAKLDDLKGNVIFVPTAEYYDTAAHELYLKEYWKGTDEQKAKWMKVGNDRPYHYLGSGKTYYLKGVAFGDAILKAQKKSSEQSAVRVIKDVPYLGENRSEKLDLYLPATRSKTRTPAIVIVHGGGWFGGDKGAKREQNIGKTLAAAGYVCASVNYRLAKKKDDLATRLHEVWPGNLHDCQTAVRFLRKHADKYNIDPENIGAIGGSAGGHLVAVLAYVDETDGLDATGPYGEFSCRVQAVVPMYGVHDLVVQAKQRTNALSDADEEICKQASPVTWIDANDPPSLILHGTKDTTVPVKQSEILHEKLQASHAPSELIIIEGAPHSFHLQPKQKDLRETVIRFFDQHLKK
ncbi:sialate O-acetylesterase [Thalassoglobus sp.]|uniref:sialate O-acetylesterase n=1 Tax=Thalassoglobus sp. TaxID=2795869 RepID=UPI003AA8CB35